ncbi:histone-lysine N-trimethyltransferase SMYD5-like [Paramacrobiotus metropolitanus]|uniref:histone-lysine N-trimethyltransferase SMYD5-like n=1 Tax=Paramacrobiotus metropolitanus TaxID=2943436 RepID=UPI002445E3DB|nr:histone-lysine N-trimethyltransferase SMYD5-like [Paramacrobiotus metropolitanus]
MEDFTEERQSGPRKGNGLFARKKFEKGDVVLHEKPLVCCQFAYNEDCGYRACEYCLSPLETAQENAQRLSGIPALALPHPELDPVNPKNFQSCPGCAVMYCSVSCMDEAARRYHRTLCHNPHDPAHPLNILRNAWKEIHFPPESFNIMIMAKVAAMYQQADAKDREELLRTLNRFESDAVNADEGIAHKVLGEQFKVQLDAMRVLLASAFKDEAIKSWWSASNFLSLFAIFARNAQGIGTSSFGMWQKNVNHLPNADKETTELITAVYVAIEDRTGEEFMDNEGSALFVRQRACNHSCQPNTQVNFLSNDFTLTLTATQPINPGDEIVISYLSECQLERSRHSRQKVLREHYLFHCTCPKCQAESSQADVTSGEDEWEDEDDEEAMEEGG